MDKMEPDEITSNEAIKRADYAREKGEIVLRTHEYDGIQEYDQKLPNWWLFTLWAAIAAFFIYYTLYYTLDLLPSSSKVMDERVAKIEEQRASALQQLLNNMDDNTLVNQWATDDSVVAAGKDIYSKMCAACHGLDLAANGGTTGRPLNDGEWFYGGKPMDVFKIINDGTPEGSNGLNGLKMVAWGKSGLSAEQVAQVTAYLIEQNPDDFATYKE
ncbi:cbb3-type cytochrome c oxidase N-terminal domain-containing protein [Rubritalea marina]|uniref:cbb3-type cytochrome c oxidase N-terminal domain-containing protein n=1 Tax=Rubritalea marina TaxID=361055 RepID=UPI00036566B0|nr:cbb3-type cytochrome c oxidase N-terminal domain-containing protein [Rubritalea marina]